MIFSARLAWRDLRQNAHSLWVLWACLMLGVALVAAAAGLFRQVHDSLLADTRELFGGDLEIEDRAPLAPPVLEWLRERAGVSLLAELHTMLLVGDAVQLVELQGVDEHYPLYGAVELEPPRPLADVIAPREGVHGAAIDPVLARRLGLGIGDRIDVGSLSVEVRALIARQPDRSFSADWRGPPVLVTVAAIEASGLVQPGSRVEYAYRLRTEGDPEDLAASVHRAFPDADFQIQTFEHRSQRMARVIAQVGSGLLVIGFSALFIGGLGVFNSVRAYLDGKLTTIATLRALGLRDRRLATVYLLQIGFMAGSASLAGAVLGGGFALAGVALLADRLPLTADLAKLLVPLAAACAFGIATAFCFALPVIGRALTVPPAALFRGLDTSQMGTPPRWWLASGLTMALVVLALLLFVPEPGIGLGFVAAGLALLGLLEGIVRGIRAAARRLSAAPALGNRLALRLALASLEGRGRTLRITLLSLGSALTVLVTSTLVAAALLETLADTVPERAPALVFQDIPAADRATFEAIVRGARTLERLEIAPLVLGRLSHVNGEPLEQSEDRERAREARDEHKLSQGLANIDDVRIDRGAWWTPDASGGVQVAFEDREADQLGLAVGDRLRFAVLGRSIEAELTAIYAQRQLETRFWFEGILSDGALDPFITRYVATAYLDPAEAIEIEIAVARAMPNVVTARTARMLREARGMLGQASAGLAIIAAVTLFASLLVLGSVVSASLARHVYDATVLHVLGARLGTIRRSLGLEYGLIALIVAAFAFALGSGLAWLLLAYRLDLPAGPSGWVGALTAGLASAVSLALGARALLRRLELAPATLLRVSG